MFLSKTFSARLDSTSGFGVPSAPLRRRTNDEAGNATPTPPAKSGTADPLFSLDLKGTPLRQALETLFKSGNVQYSLAEDVPNTPITLTLRDKTLGDALQLLVRQVSGERRLTYTREMGVYLIKTAPTVTEPLSLEQIYLTSVRPGEIQERLQTAFPDVLFMTDRSSPTLLVRASARQLSEVRNLVRFLDVAPRTVVLRAEVVLVSPGEVSSGAKASVGKSKGTTTAARSALLATVLRTSSGLASTGEDRILGTPAQSAKLQLNATATVLGDNTYELNTGWEVSLPLSTGKSASGKPEGLVRLEKRLSNVSRMRSGETVVVGGVVLSQYGLKGEILFFVTLTEVVSGQPAQ